jgi:hypothetical protein
MRPVLLEERVSSVHLSTAHATPQLVERLAWAIADAEDAERASSDNRATASDGRPPALFAARSR